VRGSWSQAAVGFVGSHVADRLAADGRVPVLLDALLPQAHRDRPPELARHELAGRVAVANDATVKVVTAEALGGGDLHARVAGVADHLADDDTRTRCASSTPPRHAWAPRAAAVGGAPTEEAAVDPAELYGAAS
jgi:nucleoside-diphosphate-sugar epimerase